jgi:hypothetical protein
MLRNYRLIVDSDLTYTIGRGQSIDIDLPPGRHRLIAAIDWARSNPVEIDLLPGQDRRLEVGSNVEGWRLLLAALYATIWRRRYLYLRPA